MSAMTEPETYALYAVRYAEHDRPAQANFADPLDSAGDLHSGPMPLDYFVWAAISPNRTIVIDTGFTAEVAEARGRTHIRCPTEGLAALGIAAAEVEDVVITHFHYDHVGNFDLFPKAVYHLQDTEMAFATGRHMCDASVRSSFEVEDVVGLVREVYADRVRFHDGDTELAPGLSIHHIGGHTAGLQVARVLTGRGWVVIASDASHLYANMETGNPFPIIYQRAAVLAGYETLGRLADSPDHIVPGHDPLVMRRYPAVSEALEGIAVRLDVMPERD